MMLPTRGYRPSDEDDKRWHKVNANSQYWLESTDARMCLVTSLVYSLTSGYVRPKSYTDVSEKINGSLSHEDLDNLVNGIKNERTEHALQQLKMFLTISPFDIAEKMFAPEIRKGKDLEHAILDYIRNNKEDIYCHAEIGKS